MHDTKCGPGLVDIAAMRDALAEAGEDSEKLNPAAPVATSTGHSVAIDVSGKRDSLLHNMKCEIELHRGPRTQRATLHMRLSCESGGLS